MGTQVLAEYRANDLDIVLTTMTLVSPYSPAFVWCWLGVGPALSRFFFSPAVDAVSQVVQHNGAYLISVIDHAWRVCG